MGKSHLDDGRQSNLMPMPTVCGMVRLQGSKERCVIFTWCTYPAYAASTMMNFDVVIIS